MGSGTWTNYAYANYARSARGATFDSAIMSLTDTYSSVEEAFTARSLNEKLSPRDVMRKCCDSDEHPETVPVILALDVTGSMGGTAIKIQKQLAKIMTSLFEKVKDIEFCIMGIGDLECDRAPVQISQFESDERIAESLDNIYFEGGGGGNDHESYTAAWYMGLKHTNLDCWKRGKKGIIITMGDEPINQYLPADKLTGHLGENVKESIATSSLYKQAGEKFDIFHICVKSGCYSSQNNCRKTFANVIGEDNTLVSSVDEIANTIISIVEKCTVGAAEPTKQMLNEKGEIAW